MIKSIKKNIDDDDDDDDDNDDNNKEQSDAQVSRVHAGSRDHVNNDGIMLSWSEAIPWNLEWPYVCLW